MSNTNEYDSNEEWKFGKTISAIVIGLMIGCCSGLVFVTTLNNRQSQIITATSWTPPTQPATITPLPATDTPVPIDTVAAPTDTPEPTSTAAPTDTPEPTSTPEPTNTPLPPTATPAPIVLTGSGDGIVNVDTGGAALLAHIEGNASSGYFGVTTLDSNNQMLDLLVNTTDPYDGVRPLDFLDSQLTSRFEVQADGAWTITLYPFSYADMLDVPGTFVGSGDYVFGITGQTPDLATISGNADGNYFGVYSYGSSLDLLVNTTDPYDGTVLMDGDALVIEVQADGDWSITVTGR